MERGGQGLWGACGPAALRAALYLTTTHPLPYLPPWPLCSASVAPGLYSPARA